MFLNDFHKRKLDYETFMLRIQRVQSQLSLPESLFWLWYFHECIIFIFSQWLLFSRFTLYLCLLASLFSGEKVIEMFIDIFPFISFFFLYYGIWLLMPCQSKFTAIISYKSFPLEKQVKKKIHLVLHAIALILGIIGIYTAFKNHNESNIPNMYSLHSWIGIGVITLYGIQVNTPLWLLLSNWRVKE